MSARRTLLAVVAAVAWVCPSAPALAQRLNTEYDEADAGRAGAAGVQQQVGTIDDPELTAYIQRIGDKLLRSIPVRRFPYKFQVVDQTEPNAFALPGGYIFVSRGLLALASNEDELACVIGHEIAHVVKRHSAAKQGATRGQSGLISPVLRAGRSAAYSRDLERTADHDGQILCASAGYDPRGLGTFLESLMRYERLTTGQDRPAGYFDSHPLSRERATIAFVQSGELRWKRDPAIGDPRASLLARTEGLPVGQRPETGMFLGSVFIHPGLGFKLRFPPRWRTSNGGTTVGAQSPEGDSVVYLSADAQPGEPEQVAEKWAEKGMPPEMHVNDAGPFRAGPIEGWQMDMSGASAGGPPVRAVVTFLPHLGVVWRITAAGVSRKNLEISLSTPRSFREVTDMDRAALSENRLRTVAAEQGENLGALTKRTRSTWSALEASVFNGGYSTSKAFAGGESVKVALEEPYVPPARKETSKE